jgi:hypothetical protein
MTDDALSSPKGGGRSGLEGVVGFAVVGEVAEAVHGDFQKRRCGENDEADRRGRVE